MYIKKWMHITHKNVQKCSHDIWYEEIQARIKRCSSRVPNLILFGSTLERSWSGVKSNVELIVAPNINIIVYMKYSPEIIWREISKSIQRWRPNNKVILKLIANGRCKRRKLLEAGMALVLSRRRLQIQAFLLAAMLLVSQNTSTVYHRSCRRLAP